MVIHDEIQRPLVLALVVQQRTVFHIQVVPLEGHVAVLVQEGEPFLQGHVQLVVQLIQFQQHAGVALVQSVGLLQCLAGLVGSLLLVEISLRQVSPYRGELRIYLGRALPVLNGYVILTLVVIQTT